MIARAARAALAAALLVACASGPGRDPGGVDPDLIAPSPSPRASRPPAKTVATPTAPAWRATPGVDAWVALTRRLARELPVGATCAQVARAMQRFVDAHGAAFAAAQRELDHWERGAGTEDVKRLYRSVSADLDARIDAGIRCRADAAARAAYDRFFLLAGLDSR